MNATLTVVCAYSNQHGNALTWKIWHITFKLHRQALLSKDNSKIRVSTISLNHNIHYFPTTNLSWVGRDVNQGLGDHAGFELPESVEASEEVGWCWGSGQLWRDPPHPSHQALQGNRPIINNIMNCHVHWQCSMFTEYITYLVFCRVCWVLILYGRKIQCLHLSGTNITIKQCVHCYIQTISDHLVQFRAEDAIQWLLRHLAWVSSA